MMVTPASIFSEPASEAPIYLGETSREAGFSEADLSTSNMTGTDFHDAAFTWAALPRVNAFNIIFDAIFSGLTLLMLRLVERSFTEQNLNQATLTSAALNNA